MANQFEGDVNKDQPASQKPEISPVLLASQTGRPLTGFSETSVPLGAIRAMKGMAGMEGMGIMRVIRPTGPDTVYHAQLKRYGNKEYGGYGGYGAPGDKTAVVAAPDPSRPSVDLSAPSKVPRRGPGRPRKTPASVQVHHQVPLAPKPDPVKPLNDTQNNATSDSKSPNATVTHIEPSQTASASPQISTPDLASPNPAHTPQADSASKIPGSLPPPVIPANISTVKTDASPILVTPYQDFGQRSAAAKAQRLEKENFRRGTQFRQQALQQAQQVLQSMHQIQQQQLLQQQRVQMQALQQQQEAQQHPTRHRIQNPKELSEHLKMQQIEHRLQRKELHEQHRLQTQRQLQEQRLALQAKQAQIAKDLEQQYVHNHASMMSMQLPPTTVSAMGDNLQPGVLPLQSSPGSIPMLPNLSIGMNPDGVNQFPVNTPVALLQNMSTQLQAQNSLTGSQRHFEIPLEQYQQQLQQQIQFLQAHQAQLQAQVLANQPEKTHSPSVEKSPSVSAEPKPAIDAEASSSSELPKETEETPDSAKPEILPKIEVQDKDQVEKDQSKTPESNEPAKADVDQEAHSETKPDAAMKNESEVMDIEPSSHDANDVPAATQSDTTVPTVPSKPEPAEPKINNEPAANADIGRPSRRPSPLNIPRRPVPLQLSRSPFARSAPSTGTPNLNPPNSAIPTSTPNSAVPPLPNSHSAPNSGIPPLKEALEGSGKLPNPNGYVPLDVFTAMQNYYQSLMQNSAIPGQVPNVVPAPVNLYPSQNSGFGFPPQVPFGLGLVPPTQAGFNFPIAVAGIPDFQRRARQPNSHQSSPVDFLRAVPLSAPLTPLTPTNHVPQSPLGPLGPNMEPKRFTREELISMNGPTIPTNNRIPTGGKGGSTAVFRLGRSPNQGFPKSDELESDERTDSKEPVVTEQRRYPGRPRKYAIRTFSDLPPVVLPDGSSFKRGENPTHNPSELEKDDEMNRNTLADNLPETLSKRFKRESLVSNLPRPPPPPRPRGRRAMKVTKQDDGSDGTKRIPRSERYWLDQQNQFMHDLEEMGFEVVMTPEYSYMCSLCGKTFNSRLLCIRHAAEHLARKAFWCIECGLEFTRCDTLQRHYKGRCEKRLADRAARNKPILKERWEVKTENLNLPSSKSKSKSPSDDLVDDKMDIDNEPPSAIPPLPPAPASPKRQSSSPLPASNEGNDSDSSKISEDSSQNEDEDSSQGEDEEDVTATGAPETKTTVASPESSRLPAPVMPLSFGKDETMLDTKDSKEDANEPRPEIPGPVQPEQMTC